MDRQTEMTPIPSFHDVVAVEYNVVLGAHVQHFDIVVVDPEPIFGATTADGFGEIVTCAFLVAAP
jgi:hypothetical protein